MTEKEHDNQQIEKRLKECHEKIYNDIIKDERILPIFETHLRLGIKGYFFHEMKKLGYKSARIYDILAELTTHKQELEKAIEVKSEVIKPELEKQSK